MKVKACCLVLALVLGMLVSPFAVEASQVSFSQNWNHGGFQANYSGGTDDFGGWGNVWVESSILHRVDSVYASFYHHQGESADAWTWSVGVNGIKYGALNTVTNNSWTNVNLDGVNFSQGTSLNYFDWNGGTNGASANLNVSPSTVNNAQFWYNENWNESDGLVHFNMSVNFHGTFGASEEGRALGRAYFGLPTPEPASLVQFGVGLLLLSQRRPMALKLRRLF